MRVVQTIAEFIIVAAFVFAVLVFAAVAGGTICPKNIAK